MYLVQGACDKQAFEFKTAAKGISLTIQTSAYTLYQMGTEAGTVKLAFYVRTVCSIFVLCFVLPLFVMPLKTNDSFKVPPLPGSLKVGKILARERSFQQVL